MEGNVHQEENPGNSASCIQQKALIQDMLWSKSSE